jgi:hypothetical protein
MLEKRKQRIPLVATTHILREVPELGEFLAEERRKRVVKSSSLNDGYFQRHDLPASTTYKKRP